MSFIEDLVNQMQTVKTYDVVDNGEKIKTIKCETVCAIITVLLDKYGLEERIHDDLHG